MFLLFTLLISSCSKLKTNIRIFYLNINHHRIKSNEAPNLLSMDSPKICFHVTIQNRFNLGQDEGRLGDNNKLHCSILQPVGAHHCNFGGLGMVANLAGATSIAVACNRDNSDDIASSSKNNPDKDNKMSCDTPMKKLKKMGWYWGSISPEYASKLLENEQDGSFLVRDSSSECYIFSMTFKLDGKVHHARIEHSKGHFSFGRSRKFFCTTIVDFIEQAIEYSQNGNLLFFLHRDPALEGPVRFRMIPLSRMQGLSSLKHMCRFAILPYVRKDKINELCIPGCLREYLNEPFNHTVNVD